MNREIAKTFNIEERTNPQENNPNFTSQRSETVVQETLKREETSQNIQAQQNQVDTPSRKNIRECHSEQKNKHGISGDLAIESPIENKVNTIDTPTKPNNKVVSKAFPSKKNQLKKNEYPHKRAATPSPTTKTKNVSSYSELAQKAKLMLSSKSPVIKEQKKKVKQTPANTQQTNPSKNVVNNFQRELVLLSPERSEVSPKELSPSSIKFEPNASDCWTSQNRVNHNSQIFNVSRLTPVRLFQSPFDENQNSQERGRGFNSTNKPLKRLDFDNNEVDASLLNNVSPNVIEIINQFQSYRRSKSNPRSTPGGSNYNSRERPSVPSTFNGTFTNKFNGDLFSTYNSKGKENKRIDFEFIKELGLEQGFSTRTNQDSGKGVESNRIAFKTNESQMQENSNIIDFIEKEKLCIDSTKLTLEERTEYGVFFLKNLANTL